VKEWLRYIHDASEDLIISLDKPSSMDNVLLEGKDVVDFIFFDCKDSVHARIVAIKTIASYLKPNGHVFLKVSNTDDRVTMDMMFLLSCCFDKTYIVKPFVSHVLSSDRFIVCKRFHPGLVDPSWKQLNPLHFYNTLLDFDLPYYFVNRVEEANVVIGQQQLDAMDQIVAIMKNKNRDEKIESLRRNHLQKCLQWCDRHHVPYMRFTEKTNIFLHTKRVVV
jgi:hypothetical protein